MREPRRFWSKVDVGEVDECWEWLAGKSDTGYGVFAVRHDWVWGAHRVAWVLTYGPIPEGLCVLHKCDNRPCCNPYHLFLGTRKDNLADAARKGRVTRGEKSSLAKLTEEEVLEIRELLASQEWTQDEIADEFGISQPAVSFIKHRKNWGWLEGRKSG